MRPARAGRQCFSSGVSLETGVIYDVMRLATNMRNVCRLIVIVYDQALKQCVVAHNMSLCEDSAAKYWFSIVGVHLALYGSLYRACIRRQVK